MRVTLNQEELFGAITDHLRDKLNLDNTAKIEISFTAGRSPKGYTADVDITYPASDLAQKCTAKPHDDSVEHANAGDAAVAAAAANAEATVSTAAAPDPSAGGAVPVNLFDS